MQDLLQSIVSTDHVPRPHGRRIGSASDKNDVFPGPPQARERRRGGCEAMRPILRSPP